LAVRQKGKVLMMPLRKLVTDEYIQSDTGMGPLDHHQTQSNKVCATTLTFDFVKKYLLAYEPPVNPEKVEALQRMVKFVLSVDHFQEIFRAEPLEDYNDFSVC